MTGIVNSTGARSGIIGTTVGTPAAGGGLDHLLTANLSGSDTTGSTFMDLFSATYQSYWIVIQSMGIETNGGSIRMRFTIPGVAVTGGSYQYSVQGANDSGSIIGYSGQSATYVELYNNLSNVDGDTYNFTGTLYGSRDRAADVNMSGTGFTHGSSANYLYNFHMACVWEQHAVSGLDFSGVQLYVDSGGDFNSGSVTIFGIKES